MTRWSYGFARYLLHVQATGRWTGTETWNSVACCLTFFQTLQFIEVLHCVVGLVPSSAIQTAMQIFSRLVVVWGILRPVVEARDSLGFPLLMSAWSVAEATRYSFYALNLYDLVPFLLTWARYTFFILLYPVGVTGELLAIYSALRPIARSGLYSLPMPNPLNVSFHFEVALVGIILSYIPFFPQLYFYMLAQRKKVLAGAGDAASKAAVEAAKKAK